jgi:hypothetical protein
MSSKPHTRTTDKNNDNHGGGPGSSHQGGSHGHATRSQDKSNSAAPHGGASTNPDRARVSGGGGERDRHHVHDPDTKS